MQKIISKHGLMLGILGSVITLAFHFINPKMNFNMVYSSIAGFIIPAVLMYMGTKKARELEEGMISFGEAMAVAFPIFVMGSFLIFLVTLVLFYVDPNYIQAALDTSKEAAENMFDLMSNVADIDEAAKEEALAKMNEDLSNYNFTVWSLLLGYLGSLVIPGAILALIISAILKRA